MHLFSSKSVGFCFSAIHRLYPLEINRVEWMLLLYLSCAFLASSSSPKSVSASLKFEQISCLGVLCSSVLTLMIMSLQPALFCLYFTVFRPWTTSWQREKIVTETHLCVSTEDVWLFSHKKKKRFSDMLIKISSGDQGLGFIVLFFVLNFKVGREFTFAIFNSLYTHLLLSHSRKLLLWNLI